MKPMRGVMIFCRVPGVEPGKTRLAEALGPESAAAIYAACLLDTLEAAARSLADRVALCFSPGNAGESLCRWLTAQSWSGSPSRLDGDREYGRGVDCRPQQPGDLGERMTAAFGAAFEAGWDEAVIVGSDIPGLNPALIDRAFLALQDRDVVFGPALDGGFYLVGAAPTTRLNPLAPLFRDIVWSAPDTLPQVLRRAGSEGRPTGLLEAWPDLDAAADIPLILRLLRAYRAAGQPLAPRLMPLLERAGGST
ncbi:MAG TPA: TIGR04282 family arsenosugar biosynthesis glycosyltransferase [Armatimonadota bacterium]|nr:TIGR04282 family arsenosugar biosynthesis glycosyltransferase [Armatimonadota bacterium]